MTKTLEELMSMVRVARSHGADEQLESAIRELIADAERYETARRMNPRQWADAWQLNISTGKPFDEIVDDLRPFMFAARNG